MRPIVASGVILALACVATSAVEPVLSNRSLQEAVGIGASRIESVRRDFHGPYRISVSQPPVDYLEIVTPFRRVVLAAEASVRGGGTFGQKEALAELALAPRRIDLVVELTFHPMNTYVGVPTFGVTLLLADDTNQAIETTGLVRAPRLGPKLAGFPQPIPAPTTLTQSPQAEPLTGGTLIVGLDAMRLRSREVYDVRVMDGADEIARATIDLAALR